MERNREKESRKGDYDECVRNINVKARESEHLKEEEDKDGEGKK